MLVAFGADVFGVRRAAAGFAGQRSGAALRRARERLLTAIDMLRAEHPRLASVLVTHHLEELPASTTHALLLADGRVHAAGPVETVLTSETVSACFDHPVLISRSHRRWSARAQPAEQVNLPEWRPDDAPGPEHRQDPAHR